MLNLPKETEVNKMVAKSTFYAKADISSSLKECFVNDVEKIIWTNKLAPGTLNISESEKFKELEVFCIKLKNGKFNQKILEVIDKAIPYYILFVLEYNGQYQLWMGYKEKTIAGIKIVCYLNGDWEREPTISLCGNKVERIYENFLSQLSGNLIDVSNGQGIGEEIAKILQIRQIETQLEKLNKKLLAEKQFNRQCDIRKQIKDLETRLHTLKGQNNG